MVTGPDTPFHPARCLAVYGTLAPGESNHVVVEGLDGEWVEATIRGHRFHAVWRGTDGYPGFLSDPGGPVVEVLILVSDELSAHWDRIDDFEGPGYRRREVEVFDPSDDRPRGRAFVYETLVETLG